MIKKRQQRNLEDTHWNRRERKNRLPIILGLGLFCLIIAYILSRG